MVQGVYDFNYFFTFNQGNNTKREVKEKGFNFSFFFGIILEATEGLGNEVKSRLITFGEFRAIIFKNEPGIHLFPFFSGHHPSVGCGSRRWSEAGLGPLISSRASASMGSIIGNGVYNYNGREGVTEISEVRYLFTDSEGEGRVLSMIMGA
jgi:hypothetical protein